MCRGGGRSIEEVLLGEGGGVERGRGLGGRQCKREREIKKLLTRVME